VAELSRFLDRKLEDAFGLGGERYLTERQRLGEAGERALDLCFHRFQTEPEALQDGGSNALAVANQPEENMFRAHEIVPEPPRFFPS
jgi:hypothetical protein